MPAVVIDFEEARTRLAERRKHPTCTQVMARLLEQIDVHPRDLTAIIRQRGTLGCGCTEKRACDGGSPKAWLRMNRAWSRVVAERRSRPI